jgi:hypothetical protein
MAITAPTTTEREIARVATRQQVLVSQAGLSLASLLEACATVTKRVLGQLYHEMLVAFLSILQGKKRGISLAMGNEKVEMRSSPASCRKCFRVTTTTLTGGILGVLRSIRG